MNGKGIMIYGLQCLREEVGGVENFKITFDEDEELEMELDKVVVEAPHAQITEVFCHPATMDDKINISNF